MFGVLLQENFLWCLLALSTYLHILFPLIVKLHKLNLFSLHAAGIGMSFLWDSFCLNGFILRELAACSVLDSLVSDASDRNTHVFLSVLEIR